MKIVHLSLKGSAGHAVLLENILQLSLEGGLFLSYVVLALLDLIQQIG